MASYKHNQTKKHSGWFFRLINKKTTPLLFATVLLVAGGLWFALSKQQAPTEPTITYSTEEPDESKVNADQYEWKGLGDEPKRIIANSIGVNAFVQKAGVDQNQKVAVPNNVHLTAWFQDSQKPGQMGLSIISGHVTGKTTDGVFINLGKLVKNDEFQIELGNGEIKNYKVIDVVKVSEEESANYVFSQNPKVKSQVNLVTCSGEFDRQSNQYQDRAIVSAELI